MGMPGNARTVQRLVEEHYVALYRYAFRLSGTAAKFTRLFENLTLGAETRGSSPTYSCEFPQLIAAKSLRLKSSHVMRIAG